MAKKDSSYFKYFIDMVEHSCRASELLRDSLKNFKPDALPELRKSMHDIEHAEDNIKHKIIQELVREFVPPLDREDIIQLANELDDVTDKIEDVLILMDMYDIREVHPAAFKFVEVIEKCCKALQIATVEFPNFQKSTTLRQAIIDVNTMEEQGDDIYIDTMRELFRKNSDPLYILKWSKLFDRLEDCCDACEHVAEIMDVVVMKNS